MLKQVAMPTVIKTYGHEAQFIAAGFPEHVKKHEARHKSFQEQVESAALELDVLLSDGWKLITQYEVKVDTREEIVFVLHKVG